MYHLSPYLLRRRRLVGSGIVEVGEDGQGGAHDFELEEEEDDGLRGGHPDLQDRTAEIWLFFSLS